MLSMRKELTLEKQQKIIEQDLKIQNSLISDGKYHKYYQEIKFFEIEDGNKIICDIINDKSFKIKDPKTNRYKTVAYGVPDAFIVFDSNNLELVNKLNKLTKNSYAWLELESKLPINDFLLNTKVTNVFQTEQEISQAIGRLSLFDMINNNNNGSQKSCNASNKISGKSTCKESERGMKDYSQEELENLRTEARKRFAMFGYHRSEGWSKIKFYGVENDNIYCDIHISEPKKVKDPFTNKYKTIINGIPKALIQFDVTNSNIVNKLKQLRKNQFAWIYYRDYDGGNPYLFDIDIIDICKTEKELRELEYSLRGPTLFDMLNANTNNVEQN